MVEPIFRLIVGTEMMEMKSNTDRQTDQINIWLRIFYHRSQLFGFTICGHNFQRNMIWRFYSIFFIDRNPIRVHLKSRIQSILKNWHTEKIEGKKWLQLKLVDVFNHKYWWQTKIPIGTGKKTYPHKYGSTVHSSSTFSLFTYGNFEVSALFHIIKVNN